MLEGKQTKLGSLMGKKRSWFGVVKRIFVSEAKEKEEKVDRCSSFLSLTYMLSVSLLVQYFQ